MRTITLIPGDGIGPEICESVKSIFEAARADIGWEEVACGLEALTRTGHLISPELGPSLDRTGLALKGPTATPIGTGHRSVNVTMRQTFQLYSCVRPIRSLPNLKSLHSDIDLIIIRENSEDLYTGVEFSPAPGLALAIKTITRDASIRIAAYAFELAARLGRKKITIVHKANIMKLTDGLFRDCAREVAADYPQIQCDEMLVDNCCMQLVTRPHQFDMILTENLYGDILSDLASGLIGGLGLAPGANIGEKKAIFEAVHGSAPDIAGKNLANPTALILSAVMLLEHIGDFTTAAKIRQAVQKTIASDQTRTRDLGGTLGTTEFTSAIIRNLS